MDKSPVTAATLGSSVIAVPPLARHADLTWNHAENARQIRHLESGGVRILLYGGNAVLGHVALSEYGELLSNIRETVAENTLVIPSVGPGFGMMMDQAERLRELAYRHAMLLPARDGTTPEGIASGMRRFADRFGHPAVLYIKHDGMIDIAHVARLMRDGVISWIKYAIVRSSTEQDVFLRELIDVIGPDKIVSGMGEQPAIVHCRDFGLAGFTSGCVCIAPRRSQALLRAIQAGDAATAEKYRKQFQPLESLRDAIHPVRVLHAAVKLSGIADTGPITPLLSAVDDSESEKIAVAARQLLELEQEFT